MMEPTIHEMRAKLSAWYGLPLAKVMRILDTPEHPAELRDEFAGRVLTGVLSTHAPNSFTFSERAEWCYRQADAMLEARNANR